MGGVGGVGGGGGWILDHRIPTFCNSGYNIGTYMGAGTQSNPMPNSASALARVDSGQTVIPG